jgi:hypothetical protein
MHRQSTRLRAVSCIFAHERQDMTEPVLARHLRLKLVPHGALCFRMLRVIAMLGGVSHCVRRLAHAVLDA